MFLLDVLLRDRALPSRPVLKLPVEPGENVAETEAIGSQRPGSVRLRPNLRGHRLLLVELLGLRRRLVQQARFVKLEFFNIDTLLARILFQNSEVKGVPLHRLRTHRASFIPEL